MIAGRFPEAEMVQLIGGHAKVLGDQSAGTSRHRPIPGSLDSVGTASWAFDMTEKYPSTEIIATDIKYVHVPPTPGLLQV